MSKFFHEAYGDYVQRIKEDLKHFQANKQAYDICYDIGQEWLSSPSLSTQKMRSSLTIPKLNLLVAQVLKLGTPTV